MTIYGFNHKIKNLLDKIIDRIINITFERERFEAIKDEVKQSLQNFRREIPYEMATNVVPYLIAEHQWNKDELLTCIDGNFSQREKRKL